MEGLIATDGPEVTEADEVKGITESNDDVGQDEVGDLGTRGVKLTLREGLATTVVTYNGHPYKINGDAMSNLAAYIAAMGDGDTCFWIDAENNDVTLSKADAQALLVLIKSQVESLYQTYNQERTAFLAS